MRDALWAVRCGLEQIVPGFLTTKFTPFRAGHEVREVETDSLGVRWLDTAFLQRGSTRTPEAMIVEVGPPEVRRLCAVGC